MLGWCLQIRSSLNKTHPILGKTVALREITVSHWRMDTQLVPVGRSGFEQSMSKLFSGFQFSLQ